jgi:hypothetical protein
MSFRVLRCARWLIGVLAGLSLIAFGPPFLIARTSIFNVTVPELITTVPWMITDSIASSITFSPDGTSITFSADGTKMSLRDGHQSVSHNELIPFTGLEANHGPALPPVPTTVHRWTILDGTDQSVRLWDVAPSTTTRYVLDRPQTIWRARLTVGLVVAFAFLAVLLLSSRRYVREYLGKSDSPPRHLLYLIGLGASMLPFAEQDEFVATWIAEIAEAKGWEKICFAADLLRVGPRIYQETLLTRFRGPIEKLRIGFFPEPATKPRGGRQS